MPQLAIYVSYLFIIVAYTVKIVKVARMPPHLRWELYPVIHESKYRYGGSYFEELEWWSKPRSKNNIRSALYMLKNYFTFVEYFRRKKGYWAGLYPWHAGFYLIITFHGLCFLTALIMVVTGLSVAAGPTIWGTILYYLALVVAVSSFIAGSIGSIVMLIKRLVDKELRAYASLINYFNYVFFLAVFLSGFFAWYFTDPTLSTYRALWIGLITFRSVPVEPLVYAHVMLFSVFLIYLPFTRSTHYITKIFSFWGIRWDDAANLKGDKTERIGKYLDQTVSWSAPHIQTGKKWSDIVKGLPEIK